MLALQAASASATPTGTRCPTAPKRYTETCVCDAPSGIIDLTTIANYDGTPRLVVVDITAEFEIGAISHLFSVPGI